jgi:hypothetical protein
MAALEEYSSKAAVRLISSDEAILPCFACNALAGMLRKRKQGTAICLADKPAQALADMVFGLLISGPLAGVIGEARQNEATTIHYR